MFSFNDEMILVEGEYDDNYSIKIQDKKNFEEYYTIMKHEIDGFEQDKSGCKFYGHDFQSILTVLRKTILCYDQIETAMSKEEINIVQLNSKRINRFTANYNEKIKTAQEKIEQESNSKLFRTESASYNSLMSMFEEER